MMRKSQTNILTKKIELIEWLSRLQDESMIRKIESLRRNSAVASYNRRMPGTVQELNEKLHQADQDITAGNVHAHEEVERYFQSRIERE